MKIKKFEAYKYDSMPNPPPIKKYFIWQFEDVVMLSEILYINERRSEATIKIVYSYKKKLRNCENDNESPYIKPLNTVILRSLFSSDDLQECIDMLPIIKEELELKDRTKKYNL